MTAWVMSFLPPMSFVQLIIRTNLQLPVFPSMGGKKRVRNISKCLLQLGILPFCYFVYWRMPSCNLQLPAPNQLLVWDLALLHQQEAILQSLILWQSWWTQMCHQLSCRAVIMHYTPPRTPGYLSATAGPPKPRIQTLAFTTPHLRCHRIYKDMVESVHKNN